MKTEVYTRREFFRAVSKRIIPVLAVITTQSVPLYSVAKLPEIYNQGCNDGCMQTCKGKCDNTCRRDCYTGCAVGCRDACVATCMEYCRTECANSCQGVPDSVNTIKNDTTFIKEVINK